jgi:hypothetical protein
MTKKLDSQISLATLILCFCLGGLVISPFLFIVGVPTPSIYGLDLENSSGLDEPAFDDDFSVPDVVDPAIGGWIFSRFRSMHLVFQSALLSPNSPPPK